MLTVVAKLSSHVHKFKLIYIKYVLIINGIKINENNISAFFMAHENHTLHVVPSYIKTERHTNIQKEKRKR